MYSCWMTTSLATHPHQLLSLILTSVVPNMSTLVHLIYIHGFQGSVAFLRSWFHRYSIGLYVKVMIPPFRWGERLEGVDPWLICYQSFPKDLQEYLSIRIPPQLDIRFLSSLYPTYKCVKPISYATNNFLEWCVYLIGPFQLLRAHCQIYSAG